MKKLFTLCLLLSATINFAQVWQSIGTTFGSSVTRQEMCIDQTTGDIFVVCNNTVSDRATVRTWNGTAWVTVGNVNFGTGTDILDLKITSYNGNPYVAIKYQQSPTYRIRVYQLVSGIWTDMGS